MNCPKCHSDDWKFASLVHKEGLSHVDTTSKGVGIGVNSGGIGVGVGGSKTDGVHQTEMSKIAAPPEDKSVWPVGILLAIGCGILGHIFSGWWYIGTAFFGVGAILSFPQDTKEHNEALEKWENSRICQKCGTVF